MSAPPEDDDGDVDQSADAGVGQSDSEWLLARERGGDVGHVAPEVRAPYERLGAQIGRGMAPSPGFRRRVLDAIDAIDAAGPAAGPGPEAGVGAAVEAPAAARSDDDLSRARRRRRWIIAGAIGAVAAAAAALLWLRRGPAPTMSPDLAQGGQDGSIDRVGSVPAGGSSGATLIAFESKVRSTGAVVRGAPGANEANVGDTLSVHVETRGPAEVRVYGGSRAQLLARCDDRGEGGPPPCKVDREGDVRRLQLEVPLAVPGIAKTVVFFGASIPAPAGTLDADLEAAAVARIEHHGDDQPGVRVH